jgi:hypothetical protein
MLKINKVDLLFDFHSLLGDPNIAEQFPLVLALTVLEEVEKNYVSELKTLRLVNRQAEHVLHKKRNLLFTFLVSHDDHLTAAKLGLLLTVYFV